MWHGILTANKGRSVFYNLTRREKSTKSHLHQLGHSGRHCGKSKEALFYFIFFFAFLAVNSLKKQSVGKFTLKQDVQMKRHYNKKKLALYLKLW